MFKASNQMLCPCSGPLFLHCISLHISGKWDGSLLCKEGRTWCRLILTNHLLQTHIVSYWILNTKQIQFMLCSKNAPPTITDIKFVLCLFGNGIFHHDNSSLLFNTICVWLHKQCIDFRVKNPSAFGLLCPAHYSDTVCNTFPAVQDYENLLFCMNFFRFF